MAHLVTETSIGKHCKKYLKLSAKALDSGESTTHEYEDDAKKITLIFSKKPKGISITKHTSKIGTFIPNEGFFLSQAHFEQICTTELTRVRHDETKRSAASKQPKKHKNKIAKHLSTA